MLSTSELEYTDDDNEGYQDDGNNERDYNDITDVENDIDKMTDQVHDENSSQDSMRNFLIKWKFRNKITATAVSELKKFMNETQGYTDLPKESRTLLKTPKSRDTIQMFPGKFDHIGLQPSLKNILAKSFGSSGSQPIELQRKIRGLTEQGNFKWTEFRSFLLYAGPVALKNLLETFKYEHFLTLHVAVSTLCNKEIYKQSEMMLLANTFLIKFGNQMAEIYEKCLIVYNVHCLLYLVGDVKI